MPLRPERSVVPVWILATALTAIGWWFGSGTHPVWWITWLTPVPVLWLASRVRTRWAAASAFLAMATGSGNLWSYMHGHIGLPFGVVVFAMLWPGVIFALCVLLHKRLLRRGRVVAAALAIPVTWVALAFFNSLISPHGTFFDIAYTQMDALAVIQLAAITGIWGIGALMLFVATAVALLSASQANARTRRALAGSALLLLVIVLGFGIWRLAAPSTSQARVGLIALDQTGKPVAIDSPEGQARRDRYLAALGRAADQGAQMAVLPEGIFAAGVSIPAFAEFAQRHGMIVDVGVNLQEDHGVERNTAMVFQPGAVSPAMHHKHHLIPGFEGRFTPGNTFQMLTGTPRIGLAICKDMDFQDFSKAYGQGNAQLLLVPAWDFVEDGWLHSRMAIMRGVEGGFAVARAARSGRLTLSDDRGRVVAEASSEQDDAERVGNLPLRETQTLYARWGNWFAWLDVVALLALLGMAVAPTSRRSR
ncbi:nitrilase-related carbon-nitrogen hydrolase [Luteibacter sp. UNCMF366Tsu5.1]|uniref:nitrilase-related carbon-nitrogen hydrolase n=1 Tax=Luteibacter sp. UNCMF366Tsu5.1 TaxID=1502758 RepID=UPI0009090325|nr:nitrilase-related carbon-nitrogen hydrolase [Luteibacter sp. UNCMF366Tsu5.1]SFW62280.1 apolipoprotein N-acyltransferase [Luteibacter sp. UNCMF366Tsu5.1]